MSANVLKTLEQVLSLSNKLQDTHTDLSSWLEKAEAEIKMFADQEPAGEQLIQQKVWFYFLFSLLSLCLLTKIKTLQFLFYSDLGLIKRN